MSQYQSNTPIRQISSPLSYTFNDPKKRATLQNNATPTYTTNQPTKTNTVNYPKFSNRPASSGNFAQKNAIRMTTTPTASSNYNTKAGGNNVNSIRQNKPLQFHNKQMRASFNPPISTNGGNTGNPVRPSVMTSNNGRMSNAVQARGTYTPSTSGGNRNGNGSVLNSFNTYGKSKNSGKTNPLNKRANGVNSITPVRPSTSQQSDQQNGDHKYPSSNEPQTDRVIPQSHKLMTGHAGQNPNPLNSRNGGQTQPQNSFLSMKQNHRNTVNSRTGQQGVNNLNVPPMPQNGLPYDNNFQMTTPRRKKKNPLKCKFQQNLEHGYSPKPNRSNRVSGLNHVHQENMFQTESRLDNKSNKKYDFGKNSDPSWKKDVSRKTKKNTTLMRQTTPLYQPRNHRLPNQEKPALKAESTYVEMEMYLDNESKKDKKYVKGMEEAAKPLKRPGKGIHNKGVKFNHDVEVYNVESYKMYNVDMGKRARRRARKEMSGDCNLF